MHRRLSRLTVCVLQVCDKLNETVGMWQPRTVRCSAQMLYFGNTDSEIAIGLIPLHEITKIQKGDEREKPKSKDEHEHLLTNKESFVKRGQTATSPSQMIQIHTDPEGSNAGRKFKFRVSSSETCLDLVQQLRLLVKAAIEKHHRHSLWAKSQAKVARVFDSSHCQTLSAALIFASFMFNIIQNQDCPRGCDHEKRYEYAELCFTAIFTVELVVNGYSHWFHPLLRCLADFFFLLSNSVSTAAFNHSPFLLPAALR